MRSRSGPAVLLVLALLLACGLRASPGATPSLVLTDATCTDVGLGATVTGHLKVMFVNKTADRMGIDLLRLHDDRAYSELTAHVVAEQGRVQARELLEGPPFSIVDRMTTNALGPSSEELLEIDLMSGTYAFVCARATTQVIVGSAGRIAAIFLVGPYKVP